MGKIEEMEKDIEEMEKVFSNQEDEESNSTEEDDSLTEEQESDESEHDPETQEEVIEEPVDSVVTEDKKAKKAREDWKKRFTKYKSATDATIHQLRVDLAESLQQNSDMFKRVQSLVEEVRTLKEASLSTKDIFSDEEKDVLGEDAINAIKKANSSLIENQVKPLQEELKRRDADALRERELRAQREKEQAFLEFKQRLSAQVKDLDEINLDPKFAEWLNDIEPGSGIQRMILFRKAEASGDITRIAGFFNEYAAKKSSNKNILDKKITPTGTNSSTQTTNQSTNKKIWTTSQIDQFMDDQVKGVYRGRESLEKEIEAEISAAISSGRVRKG